VEAEDKKLSKIVIIIILVFLIEYIHYFHVFRMDAPMQTLQGNLDPAALYASHVCI